MRVTTGSTSRRSGGKHRVRALLLATVSVDRSDDEVAALLADADDADLLMLTSLAEVHGVAGLVHERLRGHAEQVPDAVLARLRTHRLTAAARQLQMYRTLSDVASVLDVPFLTMKGPVLAEDWYGDASLRSYSDLDLLVAREDFGYALGALVDAGFQHLSVNWEGFLAYGVAEVPLGHKGSTVDLHWHPIAMERARRTIRLDVAALMGRSRRIRLGAVDVRALGPEDTLLHLCVNGGLEGARRLRRLVDVDVVARSGRVDWDVFADRARDAGAGALCAAVLQRATLLVGTPLPPGLMRDLGPFAGWLPINARIDRRRRVGHRLAGGVASGLLLASGRRTRRATAAALARQMTEATLVRLGRPAAAAPGGVLDWQRTPAGGDVETWRQRYLAWASGADPEARASVNRAVGNRTRS